MPLTLAPPPGTGLAGFVKGAAPLAGRVPAPALYRPPLPAPAPLAPAVPLLGRTGAGLALLASFAAGYAVGTWLWELFNQRNKTTAAPVEDEIINLGREVPMSISCNFNFPGGQRRNCGSGAMYTDAPVNRDDGWTGPASRVVALKQSATYRTTCGTGGSRAPATLGYDFFNTAGTLVARVWQSWPEGTEGTGVETLTPFTMTVTRRSFTVDGKPWEPPQIQDPSWIPQPLPPITEPLPEVLPLPLPQPEAPPILPQAPPAVEPLPPAEPTTPQRPPLAPPIAPPTTQPRPPAVPVLPGTPTVPTLPDGTPAPDPVPPPVVTPPEQENLPDGPIGQPGTPPRADLEGIAKEVGKIEQKVRLLLDRPALPVDLTDLLQLLAELIQALGGEYGEGGYQLFPVCETDAGGTPRPPMETSWPGGVGLLNLVNAKADALADLIQFAKELRQPVCNRAPFGEEVTVNFREDPDSSTRKPLLRKVLRYRDRTGRSVADHVALWDGFAWDAGPVIVAASGPWGTVQVWAASEAEGQRVARHALNCGGWDPDGDPGTEWITTASSGDRNGQAGRMLVEVDRNGVRITKRRGPDGRPEQIDPD